MACYLPKQLEENISLNALNRKSCLTSHIHHVNTGAVISISKSIFQYEERKAVLKPQLFRHKASTQGAVQLLGGTYWPNNMIYY